MGLSRHTIAKVLGRSEPVDKQLLHLLNNFLESAPHIYANFFDLLPYFLRLL